MSLSKKITLVLIAFLIGFCYSTSWANTDNTPINNIHINIPNAFTPDGDGVDDEFNLIMEGNLEIVEFRVYNRWGMMVWACNGTGGWDGNFSGQPQAIDTYVYSAILLNKNTGEKIVKKGDVTLLRH
jgi:gliding motility-associated-like protein